MEADWVLTGLESVLVSQTVGSSPAKNLLGFILVVKLLRSHPVGDLVLFGHGGWDVGSSGFFFPGHRLVG